MAGILGGGEKWIQGAIKHPGALRKKAKKAGAIGKGGKIRSQWIEDATHSKDKTLKKQAVLAQTLKRMHK